MGRWRAATFIGVATIGCSIWAASAQAVVTNGPNGPLGYLPLNGQGPGAAARIFNATGNLDYHGGPVMHSNASYAIFWAPSGFSFDPGYKAATIKYLQNVAADSGKATNVYAVGTQYTDTTSRALYSASYGGAFDDTTPYPSGGCPPYSASGNSFTACLTDAQIAHEVNSFVTAHSLPRGLGAMYLVMLPAATGSCFDTTTSSGCFAKAFCAYHSDTKASGTETLYSDISDSAVSPQGCGTGEYPNGHANGNADDTFSGLSHEANETITDPLGSGWFNNNNGEENGDQCRGSNDDFGKPLGGSAGSLFNQVIGSNHYYLQQEWSNATTSCQQRYPLSASFTGPSSGATGAAQSFNGSGSSIGNGGSITSYAWSFGDGSSGSGANASHTYGTAGTYTVTLTITGSTGLHASASHQIAIGGGTVTEPLNVSLAGKGEGTVTGSGINCPGDCAEDFPAGSPVTLHPAAASGSTFAGWSGACSGKGDCSVTMDRARTVTATFNTTSRHPHHNFRIGRPRANPRSGTVTVPLLLPTEGTITIGGRGVGLAKSGRSLRASTLRITTKVRAMGRVASRLRRTGRATTTLRVAFVPYGGQVARASKRITFVRR
jgi:hypothetical protein